MRTRARHFDQSRDRGADPRALQVVARLRILRVGLWSRSREALWSGKAALRVRGVHDAGRAGRLAEQGAYLRSGDCDAPPSRTVVSTVRASLRDGLDARA